MNALPFLVVLRRKRLANNKNQKRTSAPTAFFSFTIFAVNSSSPLFAHSNDINEGDKVLIVTMRFVFSQRFVQKTESDRGRERERGGKGSEKTPSRLG